MSKKRKRERSLSDDSEEERRKKKPKKKKDKKKKRRRSPAPSPTNSSGDSPLSASSEEKKKRKKKKKDKKKKSKSREEETAAPDVGIGPAVPADLPKTEDERPKMAPMTKEEWEKKQSVVRRVFDESSGRWRLIKGDGEVLEEIVSRERHKEINKQATEGDGTYFQSKLPKR